MRDPNLWGLASIRYGIYKRVVDYTFIDKTFIDEKSNQSFYLYSKLNNSSRFNLIEAQNNYGWAFGVTSFVTHSNLGIEVSGRVL